jgi:osmotically-inducible protein OsmY
MKNTVSLFCDRLVDHPQIDASELEVEVKNGEVTLSGTVDSRYEKRLAEDIADAVSGVQDIHNRLRVVQRQESGRTQTANHNRTARTTA